MISIIIPVYNVEKYLQKCLDSCFSQTYNDIEVIAVDDGSTDSSGRLLDEYATKDKRLKVFHQQNKGVVVAREFGIYNSVGDYVCFVDSDDWIEEDMIRCMLQVAIENNCDIVTCDFYICNDKTEDKTIRRNSYLGTQKADILSSLLLRYCTWSLCGKLFRRELFDVVKMPYGIRVGEDGLVCLQLHNNSRKVGIVNVPFYNYVQRASSVTHSKKTDLSLDILRFMEQVMKMKENFHWGHKVEQSVNTFVASQMFVYYVNGGDAQKMAECIEVHLGVRDIMCFDLRVIEKIGLLLFLKLNYISRILRKLYIYATN